MEQIVLSDHTKVQMLERGASKEEIIEAISDGDAISVKHNRIGYRKNFQYKAQLELLNEENSHTQVSVSALEKPCRGLIYQARYRYGRDKCCHYIFGSDKSDPYRWFWDPLSNEN